MSSDKKKPNPNSEYIDESIYKKHVDNNEWLKKEMFKVTKEKA